ncbi:hypothetical protein EJB05_11970, partial [Eragrostis curvula]
MQAREEEEKHASAWEVMGPARSWDWEGGRVGANVGRFFSIGRRIGKLLELLLGLWSIGTFTTWDALGFNSPPEIGTIDGAQCVSGCFYWNVKGMNQLIKLDITRMQFSAFDLPPVGHFNTTVVDAGEGRLGMLSYQYGSASVDTIMQN